MAARRILNGKPGEAWKNDTGKVRWQAIVAWHNSCGRCVQNDHVISTSKWPFPLHRLCLCKQVPIYPGATARPFVDFREEIDRLPAYRREHVIGRAALKLVDNHVLRWPDVVTPSRIKPLHELVSKHKLTVERMTAAGVDRRTAERAFAAAHGHTPEALAEAHRAAEEARLAAVAEQRRRAAEATRARPAAGEARPAAPPRVEAPRVRSARALADYLHGAGVKPAAIRAALAARFDAAAVRAEMDRLKGTPKVPAKAQASRAYAPPTDPDVLGTATRLAELVGDGDTAETLVIAEEG